MHRKVLFVVLGLALTGSLWAGGPHKAIIGGGLLGYIEPVVAPQITCAGGEPTAEYPYCSAETRHILARDEVQIWEPAPGSLSGTVADLLDGTVTFTVNCNFNPDLRGPCWGTFTWDVPDVCTWEGHWVSPVMDLVTYESEIRMEGFGDCGDLGALHLKVDGYSNPGDWYITFRARISG